MGYIYKITNDVNNKIYIGLTTQTIDIRWRKHLENANYVDYYLYRAMRKYGIEHFHIEMVEKIDDEMLPEREQYWINFYDSYLNGYNMTRGGEGNRHYSKSTIYSLWDMGLSISQIADVVKSVKSVIYECLLDYDGYSQEESFRRRTECQKKKVCQFDIMGNLLNTFDSEAEACFYISASTGSVGNCCNNFTKFKTVKGYVWLWEEQKYLIKERIEQLNKSRRSIPEMRKVAQLDENDNVVAVFSSAKEAAKHFGRSKDSHIGDCCKGKRKTCFGYRWQFYHEVQNIIQEQSLKEVIY